MEQGNFLKKYIIMKSLIEQLQQKAKLTEAQARRALEVFRDYLVDNSYDPDLVEDVKLKAKAKYEKLQDKAEKLADKIEGKADKLSDKAEEMVHKARQEAKKAADKLSAYLDDEK